MAHKNLTTAYLVVLLSALTFSQSLPEAPQAKFLSKENITELSIVGSSFAADGLSTQAIFGWSRLEGREHNPLIPHSRLGTSAYFSAALAADAGMVYLLRRHPWYHRAINGAVTGLEWYLVRSNFKLVGNEQRQESFCLAHGSPLNSFQRCPR